MDRQTCRLILWCRLNCRMLTPVFVHLYPIQVSISQEEVLLLFLFFWAIFPQLFLPHLNTDLWSNYFVYLKKVKSSAITKEFVCPSPSSKVTTYANFSEFSMHMYVLKVFNIWIYKCRCGHIWQEKLAYMSVSAFFSSDLNHDCSAFECVFWESLSFNF